MDTLETCDACRGSQLPLLLDAHDEGPNVWVVPVCQPFVVTWTSFHCIPRMAPTGEVLRGVR